MSLHSLIWKFCPKVLHLGKVAVDTACALAVCAWNDGMSSCKAIAEGLGVPLTKFAISSLQRKDIACVKKARYRASVKSRLLRRKSRRRRKGLNDKHHTTEGVMYSPGGFDSSQPGPSSQPEKGVGKGKGKAGGGGAGKGKGKAGGGGAGKGKGKAGGGGAGKGKGKAGGGGAGKGKGKAGGGGAGKEKAAGGGAGKEKAAGGGAGKEKAAGGGAGKEKAAGGGAGKEKAGGGGVKKGMVAEATSEKRPRVSDDIARPSKRCRV